MLFSIESYAGVNSPPQVIRDDYASVMFEAFIRQSYGKSTEAFCLFDHAREKAKKAGENSLRIMAIENLFVWYRMYASSLNLYHQRPSGTDRIIGEYQPSIANGLHVRGSYESEWGRTPEQAKIMRDFMLGIGEVIAGVFLATVSCGTLATFGAGTAAFDGVVRIYSSLNALWALHQAELIALKQWENNSLKPAMNQ